MINPPTPSDSPVPDWEAFLRKHQAEGLPEIELPSLKPGDRLLVVTEHTAYTLVMRENGEADMTSNRTDRPSGRVLIHGCTFGASSSIKPNHLFCGGNLEFAHGEKGEVTTTTTIRALQLTQAEGS
ncbi:MAG: hypothetical protein HY736_11765 [Verrucomicrobia bacterium]|nr:hypothetical protein [Verrucomicrobiota bacterium]